MSLPGKPRQIFNSACVGGTAGQKRAGSENETTSVWCSQRLFSGNIKDSGTRYQVSIPFLTARSLLGVGGKPHLFSERNQLKTLTLISNYNDLRRLTLTVCNDAWETFSDHRIKNCSHRTFRAYHRHMSTSSHNFTWEVNCCVCLFFGKDFLWPFSLVFEKKLLSSIASSIGDRSGKRRHWIFPVSSTSHNRRKLSTERCGGEEKRTFSARWSDEKRAVDE